MNKMEIIYIWMRKFALFLALLLMIPTVVQSVTLEYSMEIETFAADSSEIFTIVEEMPEIIGGLSELYKAIKYPDAAIRTNTEGRVFLQFVVNEDGQTSDIKVLRDIGSGCGDAAIEAIKKIRFTPGRQNGVPVKVKFSLPVTFRINT